MGSAWPGVALTASVQEMRNAVEVALENVSSLTPNLLSNLEVAPPQFQDWLGPAWQGAGLIASVKVTRNVVEVARENVSNLSSNQLSKLVDAHADHPAS